MKGVRHLLCLAPSLYFLLASADSSPMGWAMPKRPPILAESAQIAISPPPEEVKIAALKLSDLIEQALRNNPELKVFEEQWKAAKARVWQEVSWEDTMAGVDFEGIPGGGFGHASDLEWMISQKIPFPGKRFLRGRVAGKEANIRKEDYEAKKREIMSKVKKTYFEYFLRDHEAMLHEETIRILERLAKSAESRYATGQMGYAEVLKIYAELAEMANRVAKHYQERKVSLARLNVLLGRSIEEPLEIEMAVPQRNFPFSRERLLGLALKNRPELRAVGWGMEAAKTDAKSAWLDLVPDGQYRVEARHFSGESGIREYDQFIGVEVPILSLVGRAGKIREKQAEVRASDAAFESMKNNVLLEVEEALAAFETQDWTVKTYQWTVVPQAKSVFKSELSQYEAGGNNFSALMEAQKNLTEFRHHYFEAIAMREQNFAELERVVGVNLETKSAQEGGIHE